MEFVQEYSASSDININYNRLDVSNICDGELPECLRYEAELDLHEKYEWINRDVEELRNMVIAEPNLKSRIDKPFLLTYLRARKYDYDKALEMIQKYYNARQANKDLYTNLCPSALPNIWNLKMQTVLPKADYRQRTVLLFFTEAWNPEVVSLEDILRAQILILEHIVRLPITQLKGVCAVIDCKGLTLNHMYYLTPAYIKRMVSIIQEVFPLRFKALHFVREPSIFEWAFSLVRPFLSDTMKSRLHFHGENLSMLHDHIPPSILPEELGGTDGPMNNTELVKLLHDQEDYFKDNFSYGYSPSEVNATALKPDLGPSSVKETVAGMGLFIGSYYRRMCIE